MRVAIFKWPPQATFLTKFKFFWKRSFLAWVTDDQTLVPNRGTFCPVFTPIHHFFWLSLFSLLLCTFFGHFLSTPPSKICPRGTPAQRASGRIFEGGLKLHTGWWTTWFSAPFLSGLIRFLNLLGLGFCRVRRSWELRVWNQGLTKNVTKHLFIVNS